MNEKNQNKMNDLSRLKWACRRGMLELDLLLNNFLDNDFAKLSDEEQQSFAELLSFPDPELFALLLGQVETQNQKLTSIITKIRKYNRA